MKILMCIAAALALLGPLPGCSTAGRIDTDGSSDLYQKPSAYNFRFVGFDGDIDEPDSDRRSYYKVYIDKSDEGRTTTGLESQEKVFESSLSPNRHLVTVEKWVLDQKSGRYVKLNNIEQPKPNFVYFTLPEDRIVIIRLKSLRNGTAEYLVDFERK